MSIRAIKNHIIFKFNDEIVRKTDTGRERTQFADTTDWGFEISNYDEGTKVPRWVTVIAVGPEVADSIIQGSVVLVEALQWTESIEVEGIPHWRTDEDKVLLARHDKIQPLQDRVMVTRTVKDSITTGGIVLPGSAAVKSTEGEVVAIGCGKTMESGVIRPLDVAVGDNIVFGDGVGINANVDGNSVLLLREEDILGILE